MELPLDYAFFLILLAGWTLGKLTEFLKLSSILGMTLAGILLAVAMDRLGYQLPTSFNEIVPFIKSLALTIILLRAGLGISQRELNKAGWGAVLMAFVPCIIEAVTVMVFLHGFYGWDFLQSGMAGFMLAAVSPAVVVPSMLELKALGKETRGVITTVLAGASADSVVAITLFAAIASLAGGQGSLVESAYTLPLSIIGGVAAGLAAGWILAWWFHHRHEHLRATEKSLILVLMAIALVRLGELIHVAALLGVVVSGFVLLERAPRAAHEIAAKLGKVWIVAQILLFVLIGLALNPDRALAAGPGLILVLAVGLIARSAGVFLALLPTQFHPRERFFCVIAYWPKATVQAALGGIPLLMGLSHGQEILSLAVLAILVTAPLGTSAIRFFAARLLD